jgi:hypothetical protein
MSDMTISRFLDQSGRLKQWPTKTADKQLALEYLASKLTTGVSYSEKEINILLKEWHTFSDWALLRRELYEKRFVIRNLDGSKYRLLEPGNATQ